MRLLRIQPEDKIPTQEGSSLFGSLYLLHLIDLPSLPRKQVSRVAIGHFLKNLDIRCSSLDGDADSIFGNFFLD